jgi:hypothetical protein
MNPEDEFGMHRARRIEPLLPFAGGPSPASDPIREYLALEYPRESLTWLIAAGGHPKARR